jgi:hypothetical protein
MNLSSGITIFEIPSVRGILTEKQRRFWERWITALRSNKYKQVKTGLRNISGFSCLGVAADLMTREEYPELSWSQPYFGSIPLYHVTHGPLLTVLPSPILKELGLLRELNDCKISVEYGIVALNGVSYSLTQLNQTGVSFKEIAMILELGLEGGYKNSWPFKQ